MQFKDVQKYLLGDFTPQKTPSQESSTFFIKKEFHSEEEAKKNMSFLKKRIGLMQENFLKLVDVSHECQRNFCSKIHLIKSTYEYFDNSLKKEIVQRRREKKQLSELELSRILYDTISGYSVFQAQKLPIGEVNPLLIFLREDSVSHLKRAKVLERLHSLIDPRKQLFWSISSNLELYIDPILFSDLFRNKIKNFHEIENNYKFSYKTSYLRTWSLPFRSRDT